MVERQNTVCFRNQHLDPAIRHTLAAYPPDLLIEVPRTVCRSLEFHRAGEVIGIGQELAARALDG